MNDIYFVTLGERWCVWREPAGLPECPPLFPCSTPPPSGCAAVRDSPASGGWCRCEHRRSRCREPSRNSAVRSFAALSGRGADRRSALQAVPALLLDRRWEYRPLRGRYWPVLPVGAWRPALLAARGETHAAFERRCIPSEPRRFGALCVALRSKYTRYSSLARRVSRAPHPSRRSREFHHGLLALAVPALLRARRYAVSLISP